MRTPESRAYSDYDLFLGIDVDSKSFAFTAIQGVSVISKKVPADEEAFFHYLQHQYNGKKVVVAYEAGPTGYHLYDYLQSKKYPCLVVPPSTLLKMSNERVKNNRLDSLKIAEQLKSGQLNAIRVPEGAYRDLRHLVESRENYAEKRRQARQRIKSLILFEHLGSEMLDPDKNWSRAYIQELKQLACGLSVRQRLDSLIADHEYAREQLLKVYRQMKEFVDHEHKIRTQIAYMSSIPGIGFITASTVLGRIGDPINMKNEREIGCFVGLTPRERSTGDNVQRGHISHFGDGIVRSLLVEAAWVAIRRDPELKMFYDRIYRKNNPKYAAKKAIVAVARKLTQRIYRVLKDQRPYVIH